MNPALSPSDLPETVSAGDGGEQASRGALGWGISISIHIALIAALGLFVCTTMPPEIEPTVTRLGGVIPPPPPPPRGPVDPDPNPQPVELKDVKDTDDRTIIQELDVPPASSDDDDPADVPKGLETNVAQSEMGSEGVYMNIGAGGPAAGIYGKRGPGGNKRGSFQKSYKKHGEEAMRRIEKALFWLKRHQNENGIWDSANYFLACRDEGPKCEPGKAVGGANEALTGYALLCFLGYGYDHKAPSKFKATVKKAIDGLLAMQGADGAFGKRNYENAVCAMALAEAYGMTGDPALKEPAQRAIDVILARQAQDPKAADKAYAGLGWDYVAPKPARQDSSVTGWNIMALKSARASGLEVKDGIAGGKRWLEGAWKAANPGWAKLDPYASSVFPYTWNAETGGTDKDHLSYIGACAAVFLGHREGDVMLETLVNDLDKRWLETGAWKSNSYALYYSSLAAFQVGGAHWTKWMEAFVPHLNSTQYGDADGACLSGTWKYPKQDFHGGDTSRVLVHCYQLLALEVAIRYNEVQGKARH